MISKPDFYQSNYQKYEIYTDENIRISRLTPMKFQFIVMEWQEYTISWEQLAIDQKQWIDIIQSIFTSDLYAQLKTLERSNRFRIQFTMRGIELKTYDYIGKIEVNHFTFVIQPKINQKQFLNLLFYTYDLDQIHFYEEVYFSLQEEGILEFFLHYLQKLSLDLFKYGLVKKYTEEVEHLHTIRGKINFSQLLSKNYGNNSTIACNIFNRTENCLLNQLLYSGYLFLYDLCKSIKLKKEFARFIKILEPNVNQISLSDDNFLKAYKSINRLNFYYKPVIKLMHFIIQGQHFSIENRDMRYSGFLFNMSLFFQNLVFKFLSTNLPAIQSINHEDTISDFYVYENVPFSKTNPQLRPDFKVLFPDRKIRFFDAKYREIWKKKLTMSPKWLYQLTIYSLINIQENTPKSTNHRSPEQQNSYILYPANDSKASDIRININNTHFNTNIDYGVVLRPVNMKELYYFIIECQNSRKKTNFAKNLVRIEVL